MIEGIKLNTSIKNLHIAIFNHLKEENNSRIKLLDNFSLLCASELQNLSISHTNEWTAVSSSKERKTGIDLEKIVEIENYCEVAADFFHANEYDLIKNSSLEIGRHLFTAAWCVKESWCKINGCGIEALPALDLSDWLKTGANQNYFMYQNYEIMHQIILLDCHKYHLAVIAGGNFV